MANRYWVGGSGTWDSTSTTNWSASSGGASGASVPTGVDSVFFDQAATYTVTMTGGLPCANFTVSAGTVTFTGAPNLAINGSMSLVAATVWSATGAITFTSVSAGNTITTNGVSIGSSITISSNGGSYTLGSNLTMNTASYANGIFTMTKGTFNTGNYNMTLTIFSSSNSNTRSITLGTSTITLARWVMTTTTNLTFSGASSTINQTVITSGSDDFNGGGLTYGTVSLNPANGTMTVAGGNTFSTLSVVARTGVGTSYIQFGANQTITTLTLNAPTLATRRTMLRSDTYGTQRTLTVTTITATVTDYDFRDIVISSATLSGTRIGNGTNCSGITFTGAKTVYWNKAAGGNWTDSDAWAATSGGATANTNFPLMQDTATIENTGLNASATITIDSNVNIGTINASGRTTAMSLAQPGLYAVYGDYTLGSGCTLSGAANSVTAAGSNNQTFTSGSSSFTRPLICDKPVSGTLTLAAGFTTSDNITLTTGTLTAAGNTTTTQLSSNNSNTRTLNMGSGTWTLTGTGTLWNITATNLTFNVSTANIVLSDTSTTARTFAGAGLTYNKLTIGGATGISTLTITGSNTFTELASTKTVAHTILFTNSTTQTFTSGFTVSGTAGNVVTIGSTGATQVTLKKPGAWYVGANSTDGGNNSGLYFTSGGGIDYLSVSYINGVNTTAANGLLFGSNF